MKNEDQEQRYAQWRQLVEEQHKSGMTQKAFCKQRSLSLPQFVYYRCLFKSKDNTPIKNTAFFAPVKVSGKENTAVSGEIKLSLPNGFQCSFPSHLEAIQIKRLVEVLLAC